MDEQTVWSQLLAIIIPFAVTAISVLTTWALFELKKWIKARTDSDELNASLEVLEQVVQAVVTEINETVKTIGVDGIITKEEAQRLKSKALMAVNKQLPDATKKTLTLWIAKLNDFISGKVEVAILDVKKLKSESGTMEPRLPPPGK